MSTHYELPLPWADPFLLRDRWLRLRAKALWTQWTMSNRTTPTVRARAWRGADAASLQEQQPLRALFHAGISSLIKYAVCLSQWLQKRGGLSDIMALPASGMRPQPPRRVWPGTVPANPRSPGPASGSERDRAKSLRDPSLLVPRDRSSALPAITYRRKPLLQRCLPKPPQAAQRTANT